MTPIHGSHALTRRPIAVIALTIAAVSSAGGPLASVAGARASSAGRLVTGAAYRMKWGTVTVRIRLDSSGRRIADVGAVLPTERSRSAQINNRAAPILKSEVLKAQSARIRLVSGATMTSDAYVLSLRSAIGKAHL
jgi:uncharacterized protein with FMN-binding domain